MDNVLKRRLIGASILIALAVIFLPMLLVGPEPELDDRRLREPLPEMPDDGRDVRRIPLDPDLARVPTPRDASLQDAVAGGRSDETTGTESGGDQRPARELPDEIVLNPSAAQAPSSSPEPSESAPSSEPVSDPDPMTQPTDLPEDSSTRPEADSTAQAQAESTPEPLPDAPPQSGDGNWVVQVASFGSQESSQATRERLESLGHPVITDEVVRGDTMLYRLRTGPYANRSAAETARGQIAATVTGVDPITREVSDAALAATPGFAVQVGSFASEENAERETARLRNLGFEAFRQGEDASGRAIWKVLVGTVDDRADAEALKQRLADEAGVDGLVVSHP